MLSNLQIEILKTFSRPLPESQVIEIQQLLVDYFAEKVDSKVDELFDDNQWDASKVDEWLSEHLRTRYK